MHFSPTLRQPLSSLFSVAGKTAVITGGSGGLGLVLSQQLLQAGCSVALVDNNTQRLEPALKELQTNWLQKDNISQKVSSWTCDVSDATQVTSIVDQIRTHHQSPLNILINTAGYCENIAAIDYPANNIKKIIDVNLNGSMFMSQAIANSLIKDNVGGSIILIASMSGVIINHPQPQTPYNVSKAGVIHMAKSLASEWAKHNIRVNALSPGYIMTPLTKAIIERDERLKKDWESKVPLDRMADPAEFVGPIIYMASDASSYMTGHNLVVDGGYTIW